jgi:polysaccharide export outer membrane protein
MSRPLRIRYVQAARAGLIGLALLALVSGRSGHAQQGSPVVNANLDSGIAGASREPVLRRRAEDLEAVPDDFADARITPGYLLSMDVFTVPEFSGLSLRVGPTGDVTIPSAGRVHVAGDTLSEAQAAIAKRLVDQQILIAPQVELNVLQFATQSVTVLGEVQRPGRIQMLAPRSLADVLALAGGETVAAGNDIEIQQPEAAGPPKVHHVTYTQEQTSSKLQGILIHPGDSIFVHKAGVVYILGAVNKPGGYLMVNGGALDVLQAISLAGGTTLEAAMGGMRVYRPDDGHYAEIKVPFSRVTKGREPSVTLQLNDVLYVPRSRLKTTLVDGSYLVGSSITSILYRAP